MNFSAGFLRWRAWWPIRFRRCDALECTRLGWIIEHARAPRTPEMPEGSVAVLHVVLCWRHHRWHRCGDLALIDTEEPLLVLEKHRPGLPDRCHQWWPTEDRIERVADP